MRMRIAGFKLGRFWQWWELVVEEGDRAGYFRLGWEMVKAVWGGKLAGRGEWRKKMRVCRKCPLYSSDVRRCGPPLHISNLGCRCWTPGLALVKEHCFAYYRLPGTGLGW